MAANAHSGTAAIEAFLDDSLDEQARRELEQHTESCPTCAERLEAALRARLATRAEGAGKAKPAITPLLGPSATVGRFAIVEQIGAGGMGVVYLAHDAQLDRRVALKVLVLSGDEPGAAAQSRMLREAQAMARLNHPNVVTIYEVGAHEGGIFIAMELVDGTTLTGWLKQRRSWRDIVRVMRAAGAGLVAAHDAGVVHRDFKPDNVLISKSGDVFVSDFGLARAIGDYDSEPALFAAARVARMPGDSSDLLASPLTQAGMLVGTPGYMAPEQLRGEAADERTDQFAFCIVLYEALYGKRPFKEASLERAGDSGIAPPPPGRSAPAWLQRTVERGLAQDPADRFPSLRALLDALVEPAAAPSPRWPWLVLGVALLGVLGVGALQLARRSAPSACDSPEQRLVGVWDAPTKKAIEAAFEKSGADVPAARWQYARATLDQYATRLVAAYGDACAATRMRHTQSEAGLELRLECLDQRRERLSVISELLAHGDEAMVKVSAPIVQLTESELACADPTVLALVPTPEATIAKRVDELRRRFIRTQAKEAISATQAADDYKALISDIEKVGYRPLLAQVWRGYAGLSARKAHFEEALTQAKKALDLADQTHQDIYAAQYAAGVAVQAALAGHPPQELDALIEQARIRVLRCNNSPLAEMSFKDALSVVNNSTGKAELGVKSAEEAVVLARQIGASAEQMALRLNNLGANYESEGRYDDTLRTERAALDLAMSVPSSDSDGLRWMIRTNIVWTLAGLGRNTEARAMADAVVKLADRQGDILYSAIAEAFLANLLIDDGERVAGTAMVQRSLRALHQLKVESTFDALEIYHQIALAYDSLGERREAADMVQTLFDQATPKLPKDSDAWVPFLMVGGLVALHDGDAATARKRYERALELAKAHPIYPGWIAEMRFRLAQACWSLGEHARAIELATAATTELAELPTRRPLSLEATAWIASHHGS